jgi:hypothetical protein
MQNGDQRMLHFTRTIRTSTKSSTSGPVSLTKTPDLRQSGAESVREFTHSSRAGENKYPLRLSDFARDQKIIETFKMARLRARGQVAVVAFVGFTALGAAWTILTFT